MSPCVCVRAIVHIYLKSVHPENSTANSNDRSWSNNQYLTSTGDSFGPSAPGHTDKQVDKLVRKVLGKVWTI